MNIIQGAILGLLQGLGEFLPISSSGHLLFAQLLMGMDGNDKALKLLTILLHAGTLLPIIIVFWKEWWDMILHPVKNRTLLLLFIASLPALVFYIVFDMGVFDNGWFLGVSFLITSVLLLLSEAVSRRRTGKLAQEPGFLHAICMGVMQGLGLLPGVSRSGSTISGGLLSGLDRKAAAKFSFMMSAPAVLGSLLVEGKHALDDGLFAHLALAPTVVGVLVAAVTGYLAIRWMLKIIARVPLTWFALYMAVIGLIYLVLQLTGSPLVPAFVFPGGGA